MKNNENHTSLNENPKSLPESLPGLGISIDMPKGVQLRYDGEVSNLFSHIENIALTDLRLKSDITENRGVLGRLINKPLDCLKSFASKSILDEKLGSLSNAQSCCFEHNPPNSDRILFVIAKKAELEKSMSIFADGHGSAGFLQKNDLQQVLQEELSAQGVGIDVNQYKGEDFADLGGFLALLKVKKSGDSVFIPAFKTGIGSRQAMGRMFGLEPMPIDKSPN
jgi:hypothetical protein